MILSGIDLGASRLHNQNAIQSLDAVLYFGKKNWNFLAVAYSIIILNA